MHIKSSRRITVTIKNNLLLTVLSSSSFKQPLILKFEAILYQNRCDIADKEKD